MGAIATIVVAIGTVLFLIGGAALVFLAYGPKIGTLLRGEIKTPLLTLHQMSSALGAQARLA